MLVLCTNISDVFRRLGGLGCRLVAVRVEIDVDGVE
jgi:hypothetical protein